MPPSRSPATRKTVTINRAPVLTLWAAVVAERLGYPWGAALTFGRTVAGLNAATKARGLGLAEPRPKPRGKQIKKPAEDVVEVTLLGRTFSAVETDHGLRALAQGKPIAPASVERYLETKFGDDLKDVKAAMTKLARSRPPKRLAAEGYALYEAFRPAVPRTVRGWGAKGALDLGVVLGLAERE